MIYDCCDKLRRNAVLAGSTLNGIDFLEVIDRELPDFDPLRQRTLLVHCLRPLPAGFSRDNVRLNGGERIKHIAIDWAECASPPPAAFSAAAEGDTAAIVSVLADGSSVLVVRTSEQGDFSTYTLGLVASATDDGPPANFDPQLCAIDFAFKVECPSDFDCQAPCVCPPSQIDPPEINYLAKDYGTFRAGCCSIA